MKWLIVLQMLLFSATCVCAVTERDAFKGADGVTWSAVGSTDQGQDTGSAGEQESGSSGSRGFSRGSEDTSFKKDAVRDAREWKQDTGSERRKVIKLLAEPGDGEIYLNWYLSEGGAKEKGALPEKSSSVERSPLLQSSKGAGNEKVARYAVYFRRLGEKTGKFQYALKGNEMRLRDLENNQVYLVLVKGLSADGTELVTSDEARVIPLPADALGSPLERAFAREVTTLQSQVKGEEGGAPEQNGDNLSRRLTQFGYDFFKNSGDAVSSDHQPVGDDYVVGPGDALRIDIWGSVQARHELVVDRTGVITIPKVGAVKVWGLTYAQARVVVEKAVSRYYKGFELNLTLGRLRTIQVYVVGEVQAPGVYTVSSLATAINALTVAGGPAKGGSLRNIRLTRGGKVVQEMDFYDMFLSGDKSKDVRLENGDTLFIPVIGPVAAVAGEVKRPAIYELKGNTSIADLIRMAGGRTAAADRARVQVERVEGSSRFMMDFTGRSDELDAQKVEDRDMVKVYPVFEVARGVVTLKGNVARPGQYQYRPGMRLKDLISDYTMLLPESYLASVEIVRLALPDRHRELIAANLGKALNGDPTANIELKEQDTVRVFSMWDMQERPQVAITGQVVKPGEYPYYPHMTVRDLVSAAGSLKRNALLANAELTRVEVQNGTARSTRVNLDLSKALAADPVHDILLQPDDVLIVRGITEWLEASDRFVTLSGEVRYPGTYSISKGERLSSVIERAGGFTEKAYLKGARFTRKSVREDQQKRMDEVIAKSEQEILAKQGEMAATATSSEDLIARKSSLEGLMAGLQKLKEHKAQGRMVISLLPPDKLVRTEYDLELMGGDQLEVPNTPSVVHVMGQVYNPTSFLYREGETASSYLKRSGGPTRDAETSDMYLILADGSVASRQQSSFGLSWDESAKRWSFGGFLSRTIQPGETLVVPQKLEHTAWMRDIKDLTTIISQIALTAGTVFLWFK